MEFKYDPESDIARKVAECVQVALSPFTSPLDRNQAHQYLEQFRATSSPAQVCSVGLYLVMSNIPEVVLSGFQFVEYVVSSHWNQFEQVQRDNVKDNLWQLLKNFQNPNNSANFVQESLSRAIVEIAKKEWPQLWPNLIPDLCLEAEASNTPLLILRRLVEDIGTLQLVDDVGRRHELSQTLNICAPDLIAMLFNILSKSGDFLRSPQHELSSNRIKIILSTLLAYIEWVNPILFSTDNRVTILFGLLKENEIKVEAVSCLMQLIGRKSIKKEDRYQVPQLYLNPNNMKCMMDSIGNCPQGEESVDYLRKVGTILAALPSYLPIPGDDTSIQNFCLGVFQLASRPEAAAVASAAYAYNCFLRNIDERKFPEQIDNNSAYSIFRIIELVWKKFSSPTQPHEKEEIQNLRSQFSQILRTSSKRIKGLYSLFSKQLRVVLNSPVPVDKNAWETMIFMADSIASNVSKDDRESVVMGLQDLLQAYGRFNTETNLDVKSTILSLVSCLFVFLSLEKQNEHLKEHLSFLQPFTESLFNCYAFDVDRDVGARVLRQHVTSLFIKLASKFPEVLVEVFEYIRQRLGVLFPANSITLLERQGLVETLLIISNAWNDLTRQREFIELVFNSHDSEWENTVVIMSSPEQLAHFLGDNEFLNTKGRVTCMMNTVYGILRRIKVRRGDGAVQAMNHPAYRLIGKILPQIFQFVKSIHSLVSVQELEFVFTMSSTDIRQVLGLGNNAGLAEFMKPLPVTSGILVLASTPSPEAPDGNDREKIKAFVQAVADLCYGIIGESCSIFSPNYFTDRPSLVSDYLQSVGHEISKMDDFRIRTILRNVYRPYLLSTPIAFTGAHIIPFLRAFSPFMTSRLIDRWTVVQNANQSPDEVGKMEKEVIETSVLRLLSKEYLELIQRLLERSRTNDLAYNGNDEQMDMDGAEEDETEATSRAKPQNPNQGCVNELGDVGVLILQDSLCFESLGTLAAYGMCWEDSLVSFRASRCLLLAWDFISKQKDVVNFIFKNALRLLWVWAETESNLDILVRIVDIIFGTFHKSDLQINQIVIEWGATPEEIAKWSALCVGNKNDKKRKDMIRKLARNNSHLEKSRSKHSSWLKGLPKLVIIHKDIMKPPQEEVNLSECFNLSHP